jgi:HAD superfamily hydrolase (TIGR01509 family)
MEAKVQLVVLDIGRVMIRLVGGWEEACLLAGVPYPEKVNSKEVRERLHALAYLNETGKIDGPEFERRTGELVGAPAEHVARVSRVWLREPYEGLEALLDEVHRMGVKTACLSNTNDTHWQMMIQGDGHARLPLQKLHYRIASHLVGAYKPEPAIYEALERETGALAERIVFFDDLEVNCKGAVARGWRAHQILHPGDPVAQMRGHLGL